MPTRNVVLTERQSRLIEELVASGRYQNASEVLRDGLRLIEVREAEDAAKLEALRVLAAAGVAALERGDYTDFQDADALEKHLDRIANSAMSARKGG